MVLLSVPTVSLELLDSTDQYCILKGFGNENITIYKGEEDDIQKEMPFACSSPCKATSCHSIRQLSGSPEEDISKAEPQIRTENGSKTKILPLNLSSSSEEDIGEAINGNMSLNQTCNESEKFLRPKISGAFVQEQMSQSEEGVLNHKCEDCNDIFKNEEQYLIHMIFHHDPQSSKGEDQFSCEICHKKFYSQNTFKLHKIYHQTYQPTKNCLAKPSSGRFILRLYDCSKCREIFKTRQQLQDHINQKHKGGTPVSLGKSSLEPVYHAPVSTKQSISHCPGLKMKERISKTRQQLQDHINQKHKEATPVSLGKSSPEPVYHAPVGTKQRISHRPGLKMQERISLISMKNSDKENNKNEMNKKVEKATKTTQVSKKRQTKEVMKKSEQAKEVIKKSQQTKEVIKEVKSSQKVKLVKCKQCHKSFKNSHTLKVHMKMHPRRC